MKIFKIVYFHIYNSYYKDGYYSNDIPHLTAFGIVGCSLAGLVLFAIALINHLVNEDRLSKPIVYLACVIALFAAFLLLFNKRKYNQIYEEMKDSKYDSKIFKFFAWMFILLGFAVMPLYSYLFNRVEN
ncbi:hypothetical protein AHMF7605_17040 [Adhaeribacter arboris]|uniref:Uncharacterized protein n=1 Tax=Adhaeribacter arboris TaxID=2072846 RepID=A0A2T2YHV4_9BACT|nr:hypothetical protein [Adhaeribacter arboris]PSR55087.1 hypothetical protein AHMF7605_17040 [Adhaeribacter arboris]